jgi:hypothetical protein
MGTRKLITGALAASALLASGCGSSTPPPAGLRLAGPGLQAGQPRWYPEYTHLAERLRQIGLPPGGSEAFHHHALLHIYVNGLLTPLAPDTGLEPARHLESSLHTHDGTGVIHMEAAHPFKFTLGDFFMVWGVKLGPDEVGGLKGLGGDHLHFFVNGRPLSNPAAYVMGNNDSIVIGYGAEGSFPHTPSTLALKEVEGKGGAALACSSTSGAKKAKSCIVTSTKTSPTKTTPEPTN